MKKLFIFILITCALTSCVRKMDIEQGNIITPETVNRLHVGMTEDQVKNVMGTPMLLNTFSDNRIDYVYTFKAGHKATTEKYITLIFRNHRLQKITGNMYSQYMQ